ncbi:MAG: GNAT family N-acetyltransferase [Candidatus Bathyarchaeota archaeon]|nr:MAG: GNAT family N-acetyltransferase [Candidatus Bathyarchaeota archaeon]
MDITVEQAQSWGDYEKDWIKGMEHLHWFKEHRPFDYNREEEIEELRSDFNRPGNVFLAARPEDSHEIMGVLGIKIRGEVGDLRRWEPAVSPKWRDYEVGEALTEEGLSRLRVGGLKRATCKLKYPYDLPETGLWHRSLYEKCGFVQKGPEGVQLLADLSRETPPPSTTIKINILDCDAYSLEDLTRLVYGAFAATPEDKAIHGGNSTVSDPEEIPRVLESIMQSRYGPSPPDCRLVAQVGNRPAGLIMAFIPESRYRSPHGVIAPLGVLPEYRGRGIAYSLLMEVHGALRKHGCRYSYVGTPESNKGAIRLYEKAGYRPVFKVVDFERAI